MVQNDPLYITQFERTSIDICGHIDWAANNRQESCPGSAHVGVELNSHIGAGAGEGAGDGGAAVALRGVTIIDLNPVVTNFPTKLHLNINSFKCKCYRFSICWLKLPLLE